MNHPATINAISFTEYAKAFALTLLLEVPILALFSKHLKRLPLTALLLNLATHPMVYFGFPKLSQILALPYAQMLLAAELFAPTIEAFLLIRYFQWTKVQAISASIFANLASWWIGILIDFT